MVPWPGDTEKIFYRRSLNTCSAVAVHRLPAELRRSAEELFGTNSTQVLKVKEGWMRSKRTLRTLRPHRLPPSGRRFNFTRRA
jgi:hypothetical protein